MGVPWGCSFLEGWLQAVKSCGVLQVVPNLGQGLRGRGLLLSALKAHGRSLHLFSAKRWRVLQGRSTDSAPLHCNPCTELPGCREAVCAECLAVIRASANFSLIRGIMRHGILLARSHPPAPAAISAA